MAMCSAWASMYCKRSAAWGLRTYTFSHDERVKVRYSGYWAETTLAATVGLRPSIINGLLTFVVHFTDHLHHLVSYRRRIGSNEVKHVWNSAHLLEFGAEKITVFEKELPVTGPLLTVAPRNHLNRGIPSRVALGVLEI